MKTFLKDCGFFGIVTGGVFLFVWMLLLSADAEFEYQVKKDEAHQTYIYEKGMK